MHGPSRSLAVFSLAGLVGLKLVDLKLLAHGVAQGLFHDRVLRLQGELEETLYRPG